MCHYDKSFVTTQFLFTVLFTACRGNYESVRESTTKKVLSAKYDYMTSASRLSNKGWENDELLADIDRYSWSSHIRIKIVINEDRR